MRFGLPDTARRRWAIALAGLATCAVVGLVVAAALASHSPARPPLPRPNGYDDLVHSGTLVVRIPRIREWRSADVGELRAFVAANRPALDLARVGLGRPARAPFADTPDGLSRQMVQVGMIQNLSSVLLAESWVARADDDPVAAVAAAFRAAELGQAATQGALLIAVNAGWTIERQALDSLPELADRLPPANLRAGLARLADLERRCPPVAEVMATEGRWVDQAYPSHGSVIYHWLDPSIWAAASNPTTQIVERNGVIRAIRLARLAWAASLFDQQAGRRPRSAAELVPAILPAVPLDPATGRPMELSAAVSPGL